MIDVMPEQQAVDLDELVGAERAGSDCCLDAGRRAIACPARPIYLVIFIDAVSVKFRDGKVASGRAVARHRSGRRRRYMTLQSLLG